MGQPVVKMNDKVNGQCAMHQVPGPTGSPMPSPSPLPFSAPLTMSLATTVVVEGQPAAIQGSSGVNTPAHVGLHPSDQYLVPITQEAKVMVGSSTVFFDGKAAAYSGCQVQICFQLPGQVVGTATSVVVAP